MSSSGLIAKGKGYGITDPKKYTEFTVKEFPLKTATEDDVDVHIEFCGVCGSDVHTLTGGWGELGLPWVCVGHEIVGKVTHVGSKVKEFSVGQRVGVGALVFSCMQCNRCKNDNENYCPKMVNTYNDKFPDGVEAQGGYSTAIRAHQQFVFALPDVISSEEVAPMMCAGLTVYSPLVRNGTGPGKFVGIVGIGGLGHLAIQFAKALGARVLALSHSADKEEDALKFGADEFVLTTDKEFGKKYFDKLDFVLSTADSDKIPLSDILSTLKVGCTFNSVGLPDKPWELHPMALCASMTSAGSSHLGSKKEAYDMFKLAADKGVRPIIDKVLPMSQAAEAVEGVNNNTVRYRYVLKNDLD